MSNIKNNKLFNFLNKNKYIFFATSFIIAGFYARYKLTMISNVNNILTEEEIISDNNIVFNTPICEKDMINIYGNYCPEVYQECKEYMDKEGPFKNNRCLHFSKSVCKSDKKLLNFCIEKEEHSDVNGLPYHDISWTQAKNICESENKRLCKEEEWNFACESEDILPYPYGYDRSFDLCNNNQTKLVSESGKFIDYTVNINEYPNCLSKFGVHNMVGNVDEWIEVDQYTHSKIPEIRMRSGIKGGWWSIGLRSRCRPITKDHDEFYHDIQMGFRCCKDI